MAVYGVRAKREGERVNENRKQLLAVMVGLERGCVAGMLDAGKMVEDEFLKKSEWVGERGQIQNAASRAAGFVFENTGISKQNAWYYHALLAHQKIIESDKNRIRANPNVNGRVPRSAVREARNATMIKAKPSISFFLTAIQIPTGRKKRRKLNRSQ